MLRGEARSVGNRKGTPAARAGTHLILNPPATTPSSDTPTSSTTPSSATATPSAALTVIQRPLFARCLQGIAVAAPVRVQLSLEFVQPPRQSHQTCHDAILTGPVLVLNRPWHRCTLRCIPFTVNATTITTIVDSAIARVTIIVVAIVVVVVVIVVVVTVVDTVLAAAPLPPPRPRFRTLPPPPLENGCPRRRTIPSAPSAPSKVDLPITGGTLFEKGGLYTRPLCRPLRGLYTVVLDTPIRLLGALTSPPPSPATAAPSRPTAAPSPSPGAVRFRAVLLHLALQHTFLLPLVRLLRLPLRPDTLLVLRRKHQKRRRFGCRFRRIL